MQHLLKGPVQGHITEKRRRKKAQNLVGIQSMTSLLRGVSFTAVLQL